LDTDKILQECSSAVRDAINVIASFHCVEKIAGINIESDEVVLHCEWKVSLPNKFLKKGESDTGVRSRESVYWAIPLNYPMQAPEPMLRSDFPVNLPHINPHIHGELIPPCVSETPLNDLIHGKGLNSVLDATRQWLENAAASELINPSQGWERMRRDKTFGMVLTNVEYLIDRVETNRFVFEYFKFFYFLGGINNDILFGAVRAETLGSGNSAFNHNDVLVDRSTQMRITPCILIKSDPAIVIDAYSADTIKSLADLRRFAKSISLDIALEQRLKHVYDLVNPKTAHAYQKTPVEEFLIIFAVKRPFHLIGSSSNYELIPFRVDIRAKKFDQETRVRPTFLMTTCNSELLKSVSGRQDNKNIKVSMIGCGSLGSKITLNLAKTGMYEFELVDSDFFESHNNARHGLISSGTNSPLTFKSKMLKAALDELQIKTKTREIDITDINNSKVLQKSADFIIDTTASLKVRHFLSHNVDELTGKLVQCTMYGNARMGVVAIEGSHRNPRIDDIAAYLNTKCIDDSNVQNNMYVKNSVNFRSFGAGCSSTTSIIPDTELSYMASAISCQIDRLCVNNQTINAGQLLIATVDTDSLNLTWQKENVLPTLILPSDGFFFWNVRINGNIAKQIMDETETSQNCETGGILVGQICHLSKTIYVTKLIKPPISIGTSTDYDILLDGLDEIFKDISSVANGTIKFLGTWHSHTKNEPASPKDKSTLKKLRKNSELPVMMLLCKNGNIERIEE
jgi:molybdopterin/thiamine biosynthesis adenylyltransferase